MYKYIGYLTAYGWCLVTAFSMLLTSEVTHKIEPFTLSFFTFSLSAIVFLVYNCRNIKKICKNIISNKLCCDIVAINFTSFAGWGLMIYPLAHIEPPLVAAIILGINPISTAVISFLFFHKTSPIRLVVVSLLLLGVIAFLSIKVLEDNSRTAQSSQFQLEISLFCCYLAGVSTSLNNIFTKKIMDVGFGTLDVLCLRFYLTIIISAAIGFNNHVPSVNGDIIIWIVLTTFVFVVVPLALLQFSLKRLDPLRVAVISPLMPVLIIALQLIYKPEVVTSTVLVPTVLTWILVVLGTYWSLRK